jgi:hypothetical protein
MKRTTNFQYISGDGVKRGELPGHLSESERCRGILEAEIKRLQDFEKQVKYACYRAEITLHHWTCGDGCCSDSWYSYAVFNQHGICEYKTGTNRDSGFLSLSSARESINHKYGNAIPISEDDNYDDDNSG